jgi:hypothetical protein
MFFYVNSKKASSGVFFADPNFISLELVDERVDRFIGGGVDKKIIDVNNDNDVGTDEEAGIKG